MASWLNALRTWIAGGGTTPAPQNNDMSSMSMDEFAKWVHGNSTSLEVTEVTAMRISSIYACVALIGGAVSSLPLRFYRRTSDNSREQYFPDEYWMFNEEAFTCWAAAPAWEYSLQSLLLRGDSFWRIHRRSLTSPRIAGFEPLNPDTVEVRRVRDRLQYRVTPQPSQALSTPNPATVLLDQDDVLHIPGPGFDGLRGLSQISSALRAPGAVALGADEYSGAFFRNSARPDIVLETDANLTRDQMSLLRTQWEDRYGGAANAYKPAVLQGGLKAKPITVNAVDAQLIETRRFQVEDIARIFGVPPHMVGQATVSTWGTGIEQMSIGFVKYTLQRHLVKFEQEINRKLFRTTRNFCEFDTTGLERGDIKTRFEAYRIGLGRAGEKGWMTPNEVRQLENLPPIDDGDEINSGELPEAPGADSVEEPNEESTAQATQ
jgi:HK97 family phage portal protein